MIYLALKSAVYLINTKASTRPPTLPLKYHKARLPACLPASLCGINVRRLTTFIYASHFARVSSSATFNAVGSVVFHSTPKAHPIKRRGQTGRAPPRIFSKDFYRKRKEYRRVVLSRPQGVNSDVTEACRRGRGCYVTFTPPSERKFP